MESAQLADHGDQLGGLVKAVGCECVPNHYNGLPQEGVCDLVAWWPWPIGAETVRTWLAGSQYVSVELSRCDTVQILLTGAP